jgi:hypothetical protein
MTPAAVCPAATPEPPACHKSAVPQELAAVPLKDAASKDPAQTVVELVVVEDTALPDTRVAVTVPAFTVVRVPVPPLIVPLIPEDVMSTMAVPLYATDNVVPSSTADSGMPLPKIVIPIKSPHLDLEKFKAVLQGPVLKISYRYQRPRLKV